MEIYKKLLKIQKEIKGLEKDKKSFSYSYVTGNKLLDALKPIMNEQGLILKQEIVKVEKSRIDYDTKNGKKSEMLFDVWQKFTWIDVETGETDVNEFFASGMNDWEKGLGSALTYAERYFLLKYFHIATDEDDIDNSERKAQEELEEKARLEKEEKEKQKLIEQQKKDEIALKGKLEKELKKIVEDNLKENEDLITKQDKMIEHMNKKMKLDKKCLNDFTSSEMQAYINYLNKQQEGK